MRGRAHATAFRATLTLVVVLGTTGCTSTAPQVSVSQPMPGEPLALEHARVAILSFSDAPGHPETGHLARELLAGLLVQRYRASLISLSEVAAYQKEHSVTPSEHDPGALEKLLQSFGATAVVWGRVNQYTPYRFDRMAPATPPYVEITLMVFQSGKPTVAKVGGRKQGGLPATIWSRQPSFEDVAQPLISQRLTALR